MINIKNKRNRPKTKGEIQREEWNTLNDVYSRGGHAAVKVGAHLKGAEASKLTNGASNGGKKSIKKLLQWQKDNGFRVCDLERTDEWKLNQSLALKKYYEENPMSIELRTQIGNKIRENNSKLSLEERSEKFGNQSMFGKNHTKETKQIMRIKANQRVKELGDNFISKERRDKMREENGKKVAVYFFDSNCKKNKGHLSHLFLSSKQAQIHFKSGSIAHVLKNRAKRFGADKSKDGFQGYFAEYISLKKYKEYEQKTISRKHH